MSSGILLRDQRGREDAPSLRFLLLGLVADLFVYGLDHLLDAHGRTLYSDRMMTEGRAPISAGRSMHCLVSILLFFAFTAVLPCAGEAATNPKVVSVRTLTLTCTDLSVEDQNFVIQEVESQKYESTDLNEIAERVRFAFQRRGYFKVSVNDPVFTVVSRDPHRVMVDVTVSVDEGEIYRLKNISFKSTSVFTPAELRNQFRIADGEPATKDGRKVAVYVEIEVNFRLY